MDGFVLLVLLIVVVLRGQRHLGAGNELGGIVGDVVGTVDIDGAGIVRQIEVAVGRVDAAAHRTRQFVIGLLVRRGDELGHGLGRRVRIVRRRLRIAAGLSVQGIEVGAALDGLGRVAAIIHQFAVDDDLITHFDLRIAGNELLVVQVESAVNDELVVRRPVIGDGERTVAVLRGVLLGDRGNLSLHIIRSHLVIHILRCPGKILDGSQRSRHVVRVVHGAGALRITDRSGIRPRLAVQGVQVGLVGHRLVYWAGGAEQVYVAADDHFVTHLDLLVLGGELLVAQVEGAVNIKFSTVLVGDVEGTVPILRGVGFGDLADRALDIHLLRALGGRILQPVDIGFHAFDRKRRFGRTLSVVLDALLSRLVHMDIGFHQADGEGDVGRAVVAGIGHHGDIHRLGVGGCSPLFGVERHPFRSAGNGPVTGGRDGNGLGRHFGAEGQRGRGHLDVGDTDFFNLFARGKGQQGRCGCEEYMSGFHHIKV